MKGVRKSEGRGWKESVTCTRDVIYCPPPRRAKFQNKLLYFASIGGGAHRAKPQSPHMYQAVRDPRSNLHFNACLSSIITSGTAWLNFTDAYRALASRRPSSSRPTTPPSRLYALILLPPSRLPLSPSHPPPLSLSLSLFPSLSLYLYLSFVPKLFISRLCPKTAFYPVLEVLFKKSRTSICGHGFNCKKVIRIPYTVAEICIDKLYNWRWTMIASF